MSFDNRIKRCEGCEDGVPIRRDPITDLLYHSIKDPIGGSTYNEVCSNQEQYVERRNRPRNL